MNEAKESKGEKNSRMGN